MQERTELKQLESSIKSRRRLSKLAHTSAAILGIGGAVALATGFTRDVILAEDPESRKAKIQREVDAQFPPPDSQELELAFYRKSLAEEKLDAGDFEGLNTFIDENLTALEAGSKVIAQSRTNTAETNRRIEEEDIYDEDDANLITGLAGTASMVASVVAYSVGSNLNKSTERKRAQSQSAASIKN